MNSKRVGILTHYYGSNNYGGLLQAYALAKVVDGFGYESQLVCYDYSNKLSFNQQETVPFNVKLTKYIRRLMAFIIKGRFLKKILHYKMDKRLLERKNAFYNFADNHINHTDEIYNDDTIYRANDDFDYFITGSDQVWNPDWYREPFMLSFVQNGKKKISYAASIGKETLPEDKIEIYKSKLNDFDSISVREVEAKKVLDEILQKPVEWVLDPTLVLEKEQWLNVCSPCIINEKYIFCYFLGDDIEQRLLAMDYAKIKNLKIVTLPYLETPGRKCDKRFGDIKLYDVSPFDFLSLIKNAEYIFTDSFHACVFSSIFEKEFFVFERSGYSEMSTRIKTLANLLNFESNFCNSAERKNIRYIDSLNCLDYSIENEKLKKMIEASQLFLKNALN